MAEVILNPGKQSNNVRMVCGEVALDGSNPTDIDSGLSTVVSVNLTISNSSTPGVGTSILTYSASGGTVSAYAWKVTSSSDTTLVASSGSETVSYCICGT